MAKRAMTKATSARINPKLDECSHKRSDHVLFNIYFLNRRVRSTATTPRDGPTLAESLRRPWRAHPDLQRCQRPHGMVESVTFIVSSSYQRDSTGSLSTNMTSIWVPFAYITVLIGGMLMFSRYLRRQKQGKCFPLDQYPNLTTAFSQNLGNGTLVPHTSSTRPLHHAPPSRPTNPRKNPHVRPPLPCRNRRQTHLATA